MMGLDIRFTQRHKIICPHCGTIVDHKDFEEVDSSGRVWYQFLESIGYYVPGAEHDEWYGKDMVLTDEQAKKLYQFVSMNDTYNDGEIKRIIAVTLLEEDAIVVNADW